MQEKQKRLRPVLSILISLALLAGGIAYATEFAHSNTASAQTAVQVFEPHTVQIHPITLRLGSLHQALLKKNTPAGQAVQLACQSNTNPQPILCYGPSQIRQAYGVTNLLREQITGKGSTIVIVDAFGSPTIAQDLQAFDVAWGLPTPTLNVLTPFGATSGGSWNEPISAPGCHHACEGMRANT